MVDVDANQLPENPAFQNFKPSARRSCSAGRNSAGRTRASGLLDRLGKAKPVPDLYPVNWYVLQKLRTLAEKYPVEFVTLKNISTNTARIPKETIYLPMNAFDKWLTWGLGGDQLRILDRKVEGLLLAAELFDAAAGPDAKSQAESLEKAWKDLLASQSHDVSLCEYSRYQGNGCRRSNGSRTSTNFTWGALGFNLLDSALGTRAGSAR